MGNKKRRILCKQILRNIIDDHVYIASRDIKSRKRQRAVKGKRNKKRVSRVGPPISTGEKLYAVYIQERPVIEIPQKNPQFACTRAFLAGEEEEGAGERYCLPRRSRANYIPTYLHKRHDNCDKPDDNAISISRASWPTTRPIPIYNWPRSLS